MGNEIVDGLYCSVCSNISPQTYDLFMKYLNILYKEILSLLLGKIHIMSEDYEKHIKDILVKFEEFLVVIFSFNHKWFIRPFVSRDPSSSPGQRLHSIVDKIKKKCYL